MNFGSDNDNFLCKNIKILKTLYCSINYDQKIVIQTKIIILRFLEIYQEASDLYGLIHARFILTQRGLQKMKDKYNNGAFGMCPRSLCDRQYTIPIGMSEQLRISRIKIYCLKCQDVYVPKQKFADVDGAFFGCSFANVFVQTYPDLQNISQNTTGYIPKIFGFRIVGKQGSKYYDQNKTQKQITYYDDESLRKLKNHQ